MAQAGTQRSREDNWKHSFLWLEGISYFFQGFYIVGLQIYLQYQMATVWGLDFQTIALVTALVGIPAFLKMFSGLLSDRFAIGKFGRRKPYVIFGAILYFPSFVLLILIRDFSAMWLLAVGIAMTAWMLVDSALDGLTVDITPEKEVSSMQGAAYGGRMIGVAISSILVTSLGPIISWEIMLAIIGAFAGIQSLTILLFREIPFKMDQIKDYPIRKVLGDTFGSKRTWLGFIFAMFFIGATGLANMAGPYLLQGLGWGESAAGLQLYGWANLFYSMMAAVGSILFGSIAKKHLTNRGFYWVTIVVITLLMIPWLFVTTTSEPLLIFVAMSTSGMGRGIAVVLIYSVVMRLCPKTIEGFAFATFSSFMNIGDLALGSNIIALVEPLVGMNVAFFATIPFALIGILAVMPLLRFLEGTPDDTTPEVVTHDMRE